MNPAALLVVPLTAVLGVTAGYLALLVRRSQRRAENAIATLEDEIAVRADAERQLITLSGSLEEQVAERTAAAQERADELARTNARLAAEMAERQRASEALRAAKVRYEDLFDNSPDMYVVVDAANGRMLECNQTVLTETGYGRDEILGRPVGDLYHPSWRPEAEAAFDLLLRDGEVRDAELQLLRKDGSAIDVSLNMSAVRDEDGRVLHSRLTWRDITDRKRALETLARQAQELRRSNQELEQFAYAAAHDLQEPLRLVMRYTQLLEERYRGELDQDADDFIGFAVEGSTRMHGLLNGLLDFSQISGGEKQAIDSGAVLEGVLRRLHPQMAGAGAAISRADLPRIHANKRELSLVFEHLIVNAIKFRSDRPLTVSVTAGLEQGEWRFAVEDNGIGVDPAYAERIFAVFQRLHKRRDFPGTGIGLAICKKVVERHGGRIWVEPAEHHGARFCFTLPAAEHALAA